MKKILQGVLYAITFLVTGMAANAQTYCTTGLYANGCSFGDEISSVTIGSSTYAKTPICSPSGYGNYTTDTFQLAQGSVNLATIIHGPIYSQGDAVWIDFNNDGDFADPGEHLWSSTGWALSNTANITVPLTAALGNHRLRVRCNYNATVGATQSCANFTYGETEDYTVLITPPPPCPPPIYLTLGSVAATSATITWTSAGTAFNIQYGPTGFLLGTGSTTTSTSASVSLTGLAANTTYDVYVQNNCNGAGNGLSAWSSKLTFTTPCVAVTTFPYTENFDGTTWVPSTGFGPYPTTIDGCWSRTPVPTGFAQTGWVPASGASYGFNTGPNSDKSGTGKYVYLFSDGGAQIDSGFLVTPQLNLTSLTTPLLTFYTHMYGANIGSLKVQASTNGSTWTTLHTITGQQQSSATANWNEIIVDITSKKSATTQIRFIAKKLSWGGSDIAIDELSIAEAPPCPKPTAVSVSGIGANSAVINFISNGTSFPIEWGPIGFIQGTGTTATATATGYSLTGLPANTQIDLYIQNNCSGAGNGVSAWVGPISFRTLCNAFSEGYFENFDALASNTMDPCWYDFSTGGTHNVYAYATPTWSSVQAYSTPNVLYWYNSNAPNSYVVTPELEGLDGDTTQIRFRMAHNNWSAVPIAVYIGTMSDRTNTSTIVWVDTIMPAQYLWNEYTVMFDNVPTGHKFAVFGRGNSNLFVEVDIENFHFEGIPACPPPASASASATSATTASVSWTGSGTAYELEYGPTGFTQGTGSIITATSSPYALSGLFANTCYDVYVRQNCGTTGTSPWYGPVTFCTPCVPVSMPYSESFTSWPPSCFTLTKTSSWDWDQDVAGHARARFWNFSSGTATMRSAAVTINQKAQVKFKWAHQYQTFYPDDRVLLRAHVLGSSQWDTLIDLVGPNFNSPNSGATTPPSSMSDFVSELFYLDSATYVGQIAEFEFVALTDFGPNAYVDDFVVEAVPLCPDPAQVTISNIQGYQANVNWSAAGGSQFVIEYGLQGFGQGSGAMDTVAASPGTIMGLIPSTCYDVYIKALCGSSGTSNWVGPVSFCTTVSCPAPTNMNAVSVTTTTASISFTSGGAANWNYVVGPFGTTPATGTVVASTSNPIMLTGLMPSTLYSVWIQDSCGLGDASNWAGPYSFSTLCNTFNLNYTEDFSSWVTPNPPTCWNNTGGSQLPLQYISGTNKMVRYNFWSWFSPADAKMTSPAINISQKSRLKFSWARQGSTFYTDEMYILSKKTTATTWDTVAHWVNPDCLCGASPTTPGTLVDSILPLDTNYVGSDIQIRFHGISDFGPDFFLDNVVVEVDPAYASCPVPTALTASSSNPTSGSLGWSSSASSHQISWGTGAITPSTGTQVVTPNNTYALTGLTANTLYTYYVRDICGTGDTSVWAGPKSFSTPLCDTSQQCEFTLNMIDSFGDGWNGFEVAFEVGGVVFEQLGSTFTTGFTASETFKACSNFPVTVKVAAVGFYPTEVSFDLLDDQGTIILSGTSFTSASTGATVGTFTPNCAPAPCPSPINFTATPNNIGCDNVVLTWTSDPGTVSSGIIWDVAGFDPALTGNLVPNAQSPQSITGLTPGTAYDFYLIDSCALGLSSPVFNSTTTAVAPMPTIAFSQSQTATTATNAIVNFDASSSTNYTSITWVFGDGTPNGTNAVENHVYTQNQSYTVTLTLTNGCGTVDSTFTVTVTGIGINETALGRSLNIFPNPTDGAFTVSFDLDKNQDVNIKVLDALGRSVLLKDLGRVNGNQSVALDLSNHASGIYMVQIVSEEGTITRRITLQSK